MLQIGPNGLDLGQNLTDTVKIIYVAIVALRLQGYSILAN